MKKIYKRIPLKLEYAGVYLFFLFLNQDIHCGYSARRFLRVPTMYVLSDNNNYNNNNKIIIIINKNSGEVDIAPASGKVNRL